MSLRTFLRRKRPDTDVRDWIRSNPLTALYERTKRDLAKQPWKRVVQYAEAKTEVVQTILARAMAVTPGSQSPR